MSQFYAQNGDQYQALLVDPQGQNSWYGLALDQKLSEGGAAQIWTTNPSGGTTPLLAKVYGNKILQRFSSKPEDARRLFPLMYFRNELYRDLPFVAWPRRILLTRQSLDSFERDVRGFTMLRLQNARSLNDLMLMAQPGQNTLQVHQTSFIVEALADHVARLHEHPWNFRFGDLTPNNILVANDFQSIHLVDSDAFQYTYIDPQDGPLPTFQVHGLTPGYNSAEGVAEMRRRQSGGIERELSVNHDATVLAILVYQIFMAQFDLGGCHPFRSNDQEEDDNILAGRFPPELPDPPIHDSIVKEYRRIPAELRDAFRQTFVHNTPVHPRTWARLTRAHWRSLRPR